MEETLQDLERPTAAENEQSSSEEDGASAVIQRTPSTVAIGNQCQQLYAYTAFSLCNMHRWHCLLFLSIFGTTRSTVLQVFDQSRMGTATPMQSPTDTHMTTPGSVGNEADREPSGCGLGLNVDVMVCRAEWYYHVGAYQVGSASAHTVRLLLLTAAGHSTCEQHSCKVTHVLQCSWCGARVLDAADTVNAQYWLPTVSAACTRTLAPLHWLLKVLRAQT